MSILGMVAAGFLGAGLAGPQIPADTEVQQLPSGLQYCILEAGPGGPHPQLSDLVTVHYTGWLTDGTIFDSSRNQDPMQFRLGGPVIDGWNQALALMTPGSRFKFTIPADLAYGENSPPPIPPNSPLIFEIELLEVEPGPGVPAFVRPDAERAETLPSGLVLQTLRDGSGAAPGPEELVLLKYTLWDSSGHLIAGSSLTPSAAAQRVHFEEARIPFWKDAVSRLAPGECMVCEVPAALCFGDQPFGNLPAGSPSVWQLERVQVPGMPVLSEDQWVGTSSGLRYCVQRQGDGPLPAEGQLVVARYSGWFPDGTLFDTSAGGVPARFRIGSVIRGWSEGLQLMHTGSQYMLYVPADLAYGERGYEGIIPPNQDLLFQMELLEVRP